MLLISQKCQVSHILAYIPPFYSLIAEGKGIVSSYVRAFSIKFEHFVFLGAFEDLYRSIKKLLSNYTSSALSKIISYWSFVIMLSTFPRKYTS